MKLDLSKLKLDQSAVNIILWNITPYLGILFYHWTATNVFVCYALETMVIGGFNIFKMIAVYYFGKPETEGNGPGDMGFGAIPAFALTFGLLTYIQLMLFFSISGYVHTDDKPDTLGYSLGLVMDDKTMYLIFTLLIVSNGYSFVNDFILPREYTRRDMNEQMAEPFPRVLVSQFVVFGGLLISKAIGFSLLFILSMTFFKVISEIFLRNHKASEIFGWE